jgi:hypothetical protein
MLHLTEVAAPSNYFLGAWGFSHAVTARRTADFPSPDGRGAGVRDLVEPGLSFLCGFARDTLDVVPGRLKSALLCALCAGKSLKTEITERKEEMRHRGHGKALSLPC